VYQASLSLPPYFWIVVIGAEVALVALVALSIGTGASTLPLRERRILVIAVATVLAAWFGGALYLGSRDLFRYSPQHPFPFLGLGVAIPLVGWLVIARFWPTLREAALNVPQYRLIGIQSLRVIGVLLLLAMVRGQLPAIFALLAGVGDILVGVGALEVAYLSWRGVAEARLLALIENVLGIVDLMVALGIGFFAALTPYRLIFSDPSTNLITVLPLVMVPVFGVPLFLLLHITSLTALRRERALEGDSSTRSALVTATR
jgi:hypothetical protein